MTCCNWWNHECSSLPQSRVVVIRRFLVIVKVGTSEKKKSRYFLDKDSLYSLEVWGLAVLLQAHLSPCLLCSVNAKRSSEVTVCTCTVFFLGVIYGLGALLDRAKIVYQLRPAGSLSPGPTGRNLSTASQISLSPATASSSSRECWGFPKPP